MADIRNDGYCKYIKQRKDREKYETYEEVFFVSDSRGGFDGYDHGGADVCGK